MATADQQKVYFVSHLADKDRPSNKKRYEIQILNSVGQSLACGYIDETAETLEINGKQAPPAVLVAARQRRLGEWRLCERCGRSYIAILIGDR